jgi:hypothetical protein
MAQRLADHGETLHFDSRCNAMESSSEDGLIVTIWITQSNEDRVDEEEGSWFISIHSLQELRVRTKKRASGKLQIGRIAAPPEPAAFSEIFKKSCGPKVSHVWAYSSEISECHSCPNEL